MPNRIMTELEAGNNVYDLYGKANVNNNGSDTNTPYVFDWIGTTAQYQAQQIETLHPEWVCFITDDVEGGLSVYTKTESDNKFVIKSGDVTETIGGQKTFSALTKHNKEVVVTTASPYGQFRAIGGNYGFFIRNDGSNTYFLLTDSGNQYGTWNSLRPLYINNSTGAVTCGTAWNFTQPITGQSNRALWADLAENYESDEKYPIGTLIKFGGEKDITIANDKCNGVVSDKPGFLLDSGLENSLPVAIVGKTPVRIVGKINKFDPITLSEVPGVGRLAKENEVIIARALESSEIEEEKLLMCVTKFNLD